jgi:DUF2934 family protein
MWAGYIALETMDISKVIVLNGGNNMLETPELTALHNDSLANVLSQEQISLRAYQLYASRGYVDGLDLHDWLQAEREVLRQLELQAQTASAAAR